MSAHTYTPVLLNLSINLRSALAKDLEEAGKKINLFGQGHCSGTYVTLDKDRLLRGQVLKAVMGDSIMFRSGSSCSCLSERYSVTGPFQSHCRFNDLVKKLKNISHYFHDLLWNRVFAIISNLSNLQSCLWWPLLSVLATSSDNLWRYRLSLNSRFLRQSVASLCEFC